MIHLHVRDTSHAPTLDQGLLREWVAAVRSSSSLVVQLSTGGSVHDPLDERLKVLDAEPDSCSLTMGTTNFGDDAYRLAHAYRFCPCPHDNGHDSVAAAAHEQAEGLDRDLINSWEC